MIRHLALRDELAHAIRQGIQKQEWNEFLPGLQILAERFQVNKRTIADALRILEQQGWLESAQPRARRKIRADWWLLSDSSSSSASAVVSDNNRRGQLLIISDLGDISDAAPGALVSEAIRIWSHLGGSVRKLRIDYTRARTPHQIRRDWLDFQRVDCIIMVRPTRMWSEVLETLKLPVLLYGGDKPERSRYISRIGFCLRSALETVLAHLYAMGHRRIVLPYQKSHTELREVCIQAVSKGLRVNPSEAEIMVPAVECNSPEDWCPFWLEIFRREKISCVVLSNAWEAISLVSFCAASGLRIPKDLSCFVLDGGSLAVWFTPNLSYLSIDDAGDARFFERWVSHGFPGGEDHSTGFSMMPGRTVARIATPTTGQRSRGLQ